MSALTKTTATQVDGLGMAFARVFASHVATVFAAWTQAAVFRQWWVPKSMGAVLESCEMNVEVGGKYRLKFQGSEMVFHGTYLEVVTDSRLVWTNEESGDGGAVTTVTFEAIECGTRLVLQELFPSEAAFQAAGGGIGADEMLEESFTQLEELLSGTPSSGSLQSVDRIHRA